MPRFHARPRYRASRRGLAEQLIVERRREEASSGENLESISTRSHRQKRARPDFDLSSKKANWRTASGMPHARTGAKKGDTRQSSVRQVSSSTLVSGRRRRTLACQASLSSRFTTELIPVSWACFRVTSSRCATVSSIATSAAEPSFPRASATGPSKTSSTPPYDSVARWSSRTKCTIGMSHTSRVLELGSTHQLAGQIADLGDAVLGHGSVRRR